MFGDATWVMAALSGKMAQTVSLAEWYRDAAVHMHRGHRIVYRRAGRGESLLLLHGFPSASWDYHKIWPQLVERFDVIAPDMIGFGWSDKPKPYPYSLFDQADLVETLLAALGIARVHLLAHNYGDTVAQELLARVPEPSSQLDIASATLMNGGLFYDRIRFLPLQRLMRSPMGRAMQHLMGPRRFKKSFAAIFGPRTQPSAAELEAFWELIRHNRGRRVIHALSQYLGERQRYQERWTRALAEAPMPLALIYGDADPISGEPIAQRFREIAPAADIQRLEGIGHYPQIEAPQAVTDAIFRFHAQQSGAAG